MNIFESDAFQIRLTEYFDRIVLYCIVFLPRDAL